MTAWWWRVGLLAVVLSIVGGDAWAQVALLPSGIAYDAAGNLYFADTNRHQVFESSLAGVLSVVAGNGTQGFGGDGGAAKAATLNSPQAVAVGSDGTLYLADTANQRVRAVSPAGVVTTVAGSGARGFGGDGGAATAAALNQPVAVAVDAAGALLIADSGNHRVRRVSGGVIATVAGNGVQGFAGDGGAALSAEFDTPAGLAVMADGRVLIADSHNARIRVVAVNGTIATFAGNGVAGFAGDGGPATAAKLSLPRGLAVLPDGRVVFADSDNQRLRVVSAAGVISTLVGSGVQGSSVDATGAAVASLDTPRGVAVDAFGTPVFADTANRLVRALESNGAIYSAAGLMTGRTSAVTLTVANAAYGATTVVAAVTGVAGTPQGVVTLSDGGSAIAQGPIAAGSVTFTLPALSAGSHSLTAAYAGDGFNPAAVSSATSLTVGAVATSTVLVTPGSGYGGLPLVLTANVASAAQGSPTGTVTFVEGSVVVATAVVRGGVATGTWLSPSVGTHSLVASYGGDANFLASQSSVAVASVAMMPDFTLAVAGASAETVQVGSLAMFQLAVAGQGGPFTGAVSLSVSGLPTGVMVAFAPVSVVPGAGVAAVTMSVPTATLLGLQRGPGDAVWLVLAVPLALVSVRRRRWVVACGLLLLVGCGDRVAPEAAAKQRTYVMTVTGTGTNLAGAVVVHSAAMTLTVQ